MWMDTADLCFNNLLLLEREQISWFANWNWTDERCLAEALHAHPVVTWYLKNKCPDIVPWLEYLLDRYGSVSDAGQIYEAEQSVLQDINDLMVYVVDPAVYDEQPFLRWDDEQLTDLVDFRGQTVVDIGAGTGRLSLVAARMGAAVVYAVEPVGNLRRYLRRRAAELGHEAFYAVDGLITRIPLADNTADVMLAGHVVGECVRRECEEMERVTRPGGKIILCPGNGDKDDRIHQQLCDRGFEWARFEQPSAGWVRKYYKDTAAC